jgi:hypothetical protein
LLKKAATTERRPPVAGDAKVAGEPSPVAKEKLAVCEKFANFCEREFLAQ